MFKMFSSSSQKKYWTFSDEDEIAKYRVKANKEFISRVEESIEESKRCFLSVEEEVVIVKHYERVLTDFLRRFVPKRESLPKVVKGTAFHFYKRFFVVSSVMDYHPKEIMITCVFLACKICEYHVPIDLFVKNIEGNPWLLKNIIGDQELELLYRMNFKLNIHTPHRAVEGLMIDLKARSNLHQPERLYEHINRFLASMWLTDVCLLHTPALIALASVMHAVSRCKENIDDFVVSTLLNCPPPNILDNIISTVRKIRKEVMSSSEIPTKEKICQLEARLAACRNPRNNPASEVFKRTMMERALETYGK